LKLLLDTHAFVWWTLDDPRLTASNRKAIAGAELVTVSVVSAWEIAITVGQGKWPEARPTLDDSLEVIERDEFEILPILVEHVRRAGLIVSAHRDPFDRLLAAQAMIEGPTLATADLKLAGLGALRLW
jgi:PIN domain nuclease of toxin-antitoxin system